MDSSHFHAKAHCDSWAKARGESSFDFCRFLFAKAISAIPPIWYYSEKMVGFQQERNSCTGRNCIAKRETPPPPPLDLIVKTGSFCHLLPRSPRLRLVVPAFVATSRHPSRLSVYSGLPQPDGFHRPQAYDERSPRSRAISIAVPYATRE